MSTGLARGFHSHPEPGLLLAAVRSVGSFQRPPGAHRIVAQAFVKQERLQFAP